MLVNGKRALAYTAACGPITPILGADNIDLMQVDGWKLIVKKGEFKEGDTCVYFETDSKLPERPWSEFMASKHYKVKIMKLSKFGVWSEGLALPLSVFTEDIPNRPGVDVTDILGVKYSVEEDNVRKASTNELKYKSMAARHQKLFKKKPFRWMMRRAWGRKILFAFFGKKKDSPRKFPEFIKRSDENRIENEIFRLGDGKTYLVSEKIDGTSCSYGLKRKRFGKFEYFVCSRNVRQQDENQKCYHDYNIYWFLSHKYDIENHLRQYMKQNPNLDWVYIQGEGVGSVQGNPLKLDEDDLYVFNFVRSDCGRLPSENGKEVIDSWGMKWVPLLGYTTLPTNIDEVKELAEGKSAINPKVKREGLVCRSLDGKESFKNVSRSYQLKHSN